MTEERRISMAPCASIRRCSLRWYHEGPCLFDLSPSDVSDVRIATLVEAAKLACEGCAECVEDGRFGWILRLNEAGGEVVHHDDEYHGDGGHGVQCTAEGIILKLVEEWR